MWSLRNQTGHALRLSSRLARFSSGKGFVHSTHKKFGFTKSFRQTGLLPRLQIVLDDSNTFADVDPDVELHRSSPHDIFKDFAKRYPEVGNIFQ
jgi:hypothetical protein